MASGTLLLRFTAPETPEDWSDVSRFHIYPDDVLLLTHEDYTDRIEQQNLTYEEMIREAGIIIGEDRAFRVAFRVSPSGFGGGSRCGTREPAECLVVRFYQPGMSDRDCKDIVEKAQWQPMPPIYPGFYPTECVWNQQGCIMTDPERPKLPIYYDHLTQEVSLEGAWLEAGWPLKSLRQWQSPLLYYPRNWYDPPLVGGERPLEAVVVAPIPGGDENVSRQYQPIDSNFDFTVPATPLGQVIGARLPHRILIQGGEYGGLVEAGDDDTAPQPQIYQPPEDEEDEDPRFEDLSGLDLYVDHMLRVDDTTVADYLSQFGSKALDWVDYPLRWQSGFGWGQWIFRLAHNCEGGSNVHEVRMIRSRPSNPFSPSLPQCEFAAAALRPKRIWLRIDMKAPGNTIFDAEGGGYFDAIFSPAEWKVYSPNEDLELNGSYLMSIYGWGNVADLYPYCYTGDFNQYEQFCHFQSWVDLEAYRNMTRDPETGEYETEIIFLLSQDWDGLGRYPFHDYTLSVTAYANGCVVPGCEPEQEERRYGSPFVCTGEELGHVEWSSKLCGIGIEGYVPLGFFEVRYDYSDEQRMREFEVITRSGKMYSTTKPLPE
mgnify:CR=1 FL=1